MRRYSARSLAAAYLCGAMGLLLGGCPRPKDRFEPNDSAEQATPLRLNETIHARANQGDPDVFAITLDAPSASTSATAVRMLEFSFTTESGEVCPAFEIAAPDGSLLYQDTNQFCSRVFADPVAVTGADLQVQAGDAFILQVPASADGTYVITVDEKGQVDNVFDFGWDYALTARLPN